LILEIGNIMIALHAKETRSLRHHGISPCGREIGVITLRLVWEPY
jgi:hypothetical protein